jgi:glutaredoxin 3
MAEIILYTKNDCPYCTRAKELLASKGAVFTEIDIQKLPERRVEMIEKASGRTTVPQIFINQQHIGGCDDLYALNERGGLDPLLSS